MANLPCKRRIHIAPVGFEVDRVVIPLEKYHADKVWLLSEQSGEEDDGKPFFDQVIHKIESLPHPCKWEQKKHNVVNRDLFSAMRSFREIIETESENQIFVNVSTGTKIQAIAGMMACMMFKSGEEHPIPYYVIPEDYPDQRGKDEQMTIGCKAVVPLPNYRIEKPDKVLVRTLEIVKELSADDSTVTKKELINSLVEKGVIKGDVISKNMPQNKKVSAYQKLDRKIIAPLRDVWKCIKIEGNGRAARISLTIDGENMLFLLGDIYSQSDN